MYQISGKLSFMKLDQGRMLADLKRRAEVQVRQAMRHGLRQLLVESAQGTGFPVYTGMALGSLRPIARFLNAALPIRPVAKRSGETPEAGEALTSFKAIRGRGSAGYGFEMTIRTPHFVRLDVEPAPAAMQARLKHPTPWRSMDVMSKRFNEYIHANLPKHFVNLSEFATVTEVLF